MKVNRFQEAKPYIAPNHFDVCALRLQGFEENGPTTCWVGLSHFLPGGGAGPDASALEKIYVVLAGELVVKTTTAEVTLYANDSCCIEAGEMREIKNRSNHVTTMLVVMPYPEKTQ